MNRVLFSSTILCLLLIACGNTVQQSDKVANTAIEAQKPDAENHLSMKINGVEWKADHNIFGAFHPKGYNKVLMIAGSKGPKDKNEQFSFPAAQEMFEHGNRPFTMRTLCRNTTVDRQRTEQRQQHQNQRCDGRERTCR